MCTTWAPIDSFPGNRTAPELTTHRPCPVCDGLEYRPVLELSEFQFFSDSDREPKRVDVRTVQCKHCFSLYMNPAYSPTGFRTLFAEAGRSYGASAGRAEEQRDWMASRGLLAPGISILDVGCYDGSFLGVLPDGIKRIGVDVDSKAIARARKRFGEEDALFVLGDFETFHLSERPDVITLFHVLEHLSRPRPVLERLRTMAAPDARLVLEVPILENGSTNDINGFLSVQHTTHFSRSSIGNCLEMSGWAVMESQEQSGYNGYRLLCRPTELKDTVTPGRDDTALLHRYLASWRTALTRVEENCRKLDQEQVIVIWGAGLHTEFLYHVTTLFSSKPNRRYALVDSDPVKQGRSWRGLKIHPPEAVIPDLDTNRAVLVSSYGGQEAIRRAAVALGMAPSRVRTLYEEIRVY